MKNCDYKVFKETIRTCPENDTIWWAGYLFLRLTKKQTEEVIEILIGRGFPVVEGFRGKMVQTPSGLGIWIEQ